MACAIFLDVNAYSGPCHPTTPTNYSSGSIEDSRCRGDDVAPINEFPHHVIFQIGTRITGSFPACSLYGEDNRTMAEGRVKANGGGRKSV